LACLHTQVSYPTNSSSCRGPTPEPRRQPENLTGKNHQNIGGKDPGALQLALNEIDKFVLQNHLNDLAKSYSYSIVQHVHSFLQDIFAEACDLDFVLKNPTNRLQIPRVVRTRILDPTNGLDTGKHFLSTEQLTKLLTYLPNIHKPDRLVVMLASLCALRPGEIFGLTWQCYTDSGIYVMERVYRGVLDTPKSEASQTTLPVPTIVCAALDKWKGECYDSFPGAFVFATKNRTPLNVYNFSQRVLRPAGSVTSMGQSVTFQMLRRTWATHARYYGADLKTIEVVLRHSACLNFTTETYIQGMQEKVLNVMNSFAEAVASNLPDYEWLTVPVESQAPIYGHICPRESL